MWAGDCLASHFQISSDSKSTASDCRPLSLTLPFEDHVAKTMQKTCKTFVRWSTTEAAEALAVGETLHLREPPSHFDLGAPLFALLALLNACVQLGARGAGSG